jgi:hypothetical protein
MQFRLSLAQNKFMAWSMRTGRTKSLRAASTKARADGYDRKQQWKEKPGHRYTPRELRLMSKSLGPFRIVQPEFHVMELD